MQYKGKILPLIIEPDPSLHKISANVIEITSDIRQMMHDMVMTMYHNEGMGLAAVQVGVHLRVIVIDIPHEEITKPLFLINPEIIERSDEIITFCEGCLSLPMITAEVQRNKWIIVNYLDYDGNLQSLKCDDLLSVCMQHEIDHINGIIFLDHLSKLKKDIFLKKLIKNKLNQQ